MWRYKLRIQKRLPQVGLWASFFVPGIGFIATGFCMVGYILIGLSIVLLFFFVLYRPLKKEIPPMDIAVKQSKVIWGMWFTGDRMLKDFISKGKYKQFRRILLMEPDSKAFRKTLEETSGSESLARKEILQLTREGKEKGIEVRWYSNFIAFGLTIYDQMDGEEPKSNKSYCVVQVLKKSAPVDERDRYMAKSGESYFRGKFDKFMEIWNDDMLSREPQKSDCEEVDMTEYKNNPKKKQGGGITKKLFHSILAKASQPIKKSEKGKS